MNHKIKVIGLGGFAGVGKTSVAKCLELNLGYERVSFAWPLREMLLSMGMTATELANKEVPIPRFGNKTPRFLLQTLGTEWGRDMVSKTLWVDIAKEMAQQLIDKHISVVFDDVRFPEEVAAIKSLLDNANIVRLWRVLPAREFEAKHVSETQDLMLPSLDITGQSPCDVAHLLDSFASFGLDKSEKF